MKRNSVRFLLVLLLVFCSATAIGKGGNPHPKSIMGTLSGEATFPESENCLSITGAPWQTATATVGQMKHLGLTRQYSTHCSTLVGMSLVAGESTLVAANGDEIWMTYTADLIGPPPVMVFLTDYVIVGGTGRFKNASGNILAFVYVTFEGLDDPAWPTDMDFAGSITY